MTTSDPVRDAVSAGMTRVCDDIAGALRPLGFIAARRGARKWQREHDGGVDIIQLERSGSSYGAPINASVRLRLLLTTRRADGGTDARRLDRELDADGRGYHLRFNATTGSTYERCLADLERMVRDHALPWFAQARGAGAVAGAGP